MKLSEKYFEKLKSEEQVSHEISHSAIKLYGEICRLEGQMQYGISPERDEAREKLRQIATENNL